MEYTKYLLVHVLLSWSFFLFFLPIALLTDHSFKTKKYTKRSKKKDDDRELADWMWVSTLISLVLGLILTVPIVPDIIKPEYECVHGNYEFSESLGADTITVTLKNGEEREFRILGGYGLLDEPYPRGNYDATVWYTVHGEYVVEVIIDDM